MFIYDVNITYVYDRIYSYGAILCKLKINNQLNTFDDQKYKALLLMNTYQVHKDSLYNPASYTTVGGSISTVSMATARTVTNHSRRNVR